MKTCTKCSRTKPLAEFQKHSNTRDKLRPDCRSCQKTYQAASRKKHGPEYYKRYDLKRFYGMTLEEYQQRLTDQNGLCAICGTDQPRGPANVLAVDHDHKTKKVRGLLCQTCNTGLGLFADDVSLLASAIQYLSAHRKGI